MNHFASLYAILAIDVHFFSKIKRRSSLQSEFHLALKIGIAANLNFRKKGLKFIHRSTTLLIVINITDAIQ